MLFEECVNSRKEVADDDVLDAVLSRRGQVSSSQPEEVEEAVLDRPELAKSCCGEDMFEFW